MIETSSLASSSPRMVPDDRRCDQAPASETGRPRGADPRVGDGGRASQSPPAVGTQGRRRWQRSLTWGSLGLLVSGVGGMAWLSRQPSRMPPRPPHHSDFAASARPGAALPAAHPPHPGPVAYGSCEPGGSPPLASHTHHPQRPWPGARRPGPGVWDLRHTPGSAMLPHAPVCARVRLRRARPVLARGRLPGRPRRRPRGGAPPPPRRRASGPGSGTASRRQATADTRRSATPPVPVMPPPSGRRCTRRGERCLERPQAWERGAGMVRRMDVRTYPAPWPRVSREVRTSRVGQGRKRGCSTLCTRVLSTWSPSMAPRDF